MKKLLLGLLCLPLTSLAMEEGKQLAKSLTNEFLVNGKIVREPVRFEDQTKLKIALSKQQLEKKLKQVKGYKTSSSSNFFTASACWTLLLSSTVTDATNYLEYKAQSSFVSGGFATAKLLVLYHAMSGTVKGAVDYYKYRMSDEESLTDEITVHDEAIRMLNEVKSENNENTSNKAQNYSALIRKQ
ncbi:hypothetical protein Noda2021_09640 [Candidatus Dependentiae bacterium Noda2021]|nr:hypothetical protein Noda2021_09640 [Candidatus Dependentiae bacterium Noda2021]